MTPFGRRLSVPPSCARCPYRLCTQAGTLKHRQRKGTGLPPHVAAVNRYAAGSDSGATEHWVAVPPDRAPQPVRRLGACTADLEALADWLPQCGVTTVARESTGVYWIPLFE